jgi:hypothetical protein
VVLGWVTNLIGFSNNAMPTTVLIPDDTDTAVGWGPRQLPTLYNILLHMLYANRATIPPAIAANFVSPAAAGAAYQILPAVNRLFRREVQAQRGSSTGVARFPTAIANAIA